MSSMPIASKTAEERLAVILSNQYHRRMYQNRPQWYKENPLDTAPKCFAPWRRNDAPLIRDWETYHRVVAKKAAWMGKVFADKYYDINGVIWAWQDPASHFLVELFTSDTMQTVEFAISSEPFWAPHIVVTHSPGDEPGYLDTHRNPDQLTAPPPAIVPNPWGCTPRQSFVGPTGKDQLLLPPRMSLSFERDEYTQLCAAVTINRRNVLLRLSIQFHEGLRKIRARRELLRSVGHSLEKDGLSARGRHTSCKAISSSRITISDVISEEPDFEPLTQYEIKASGFSDSDAAESLFARCGIMFQPQLDDISLLADAAILSESEDDDDEESSSSLPRSPTIASDTFEVLRRLGMVHCETIDSEDEEEDADDGDEDEDEDDESTEGLPIPGPMTSDSGSMTDQGDLASSSWEAESTVFPISSGSLDLASMLNKDADDEESSVSSLFVGEDQDSIASDCETPDTEDEC